MSEMCGFVIANTAEGGSLNCNRPLGHDGQHQWTGNFTHNGGKLFTEADLLRAREEGSKRMACGHLQADWVEGTLGDIKITVSHGALPAAAPPSWRKNIGEVVEAPLGYCRICAELQKVREEATVAAAGAQHAKDTEIAKSKYQEWVGTGFGAVTTELHNTYVAIRNAPLVTSDEGADWLRKHDAGVRASMSDGYHTFDELYEHRHAQFSVICHTFNGWKSKLHDDGTMFYGWFIAGVPTAQGQATYHLPISWWDRFKCAEIKRAPKWDGHTPADVVYRLQTLIEAPSTGTSAGTP